MNRTWQRPLLSGGGEKKVAVIMSFFIRRNNPTTLNIRSINAKYKTIKYQYLIKKHQ
ncbi:hypothetical protein BN1183_CH_00030 [Pantoea ananatis]|nr:hypothetical protein BN1183_CH_00030 [Pantoea ananatis]